MRPPHDLYTPEQVADFLALPLKLVRGLQHGTYALHDHFEFYQITLNNAGPWGDVEIIPFRVHDRITDEIWTKIKSEIEFGAKHDPGKTQKIFDDAHADMRLVQHKMIPALGKVFQEHDPENTTHEIKQTPSGSRIGLIGDWATSNRAVIPLPEFKVDHDWTMHVDVTHIELKHHDKIYAAIKDHLPEHHRFIRAK